MKADYSLKKGMENNIIVYEGSTAEGLAADFARQHALDESTELKLCNLIQSHMSKLLLRIDEENQSVSDKSSSHKI